jgi:hypothetical protein
VEGARLARSRHTLRESYTPARLRCGGRPKAKLLPAAPSGELDCDPSFYVVDIDNGHLL